MVSLKQLKYAQTVAETLHFKKAANICNISQSALSTAITQLENQLNTTIFERDNKKVLLTPTGKKIIDYAEKILSQINDLKHIADTDNDISKVSLSIGMIPTIAPYILPKFMPIIHKRYPQSKIQIYEEQSHKLVEKVKKGQLDTAILALPYPIDGLLAMEFHQEDFFWILPKHKETIKPKNVNAKSITAHNLMLLQEGHCLKDHIVDVCNFNPSEHAYSINASSINTLVEMVKSNMGTTLIPEMAIDQLINENSPLTAIHLNETSPHRRIAFIVRPNYTRVVIIDLLINICKEIL